MSERDAGAMPGWVGDLYDDLLADLLLERDDVAAEITFLWQELDLAEGRSVLDQGCGIGSLALPLARRGVRVIGVDLAAAYVARARDQAARERIAAVFHAADARCFVPEAPVDAAFSWWTSWGHAADDAGNLAMFQRLREALVPGGRFALDTMNVPGVIRAFETVTTLRRTVPARGGEVRLDRTSRIDADQGVLLKDWVYHLPDGARVTHSSRMRLYMPWQIADMLRMAGFGDIRLLGDLEGAALTLDHRRLIVLARRR